MRKPAKKRFTVKASRNVNAKRSAMRRRPIKAAVDLSNPYIRIFLTNLGKYNEGEIVGEWVDLPVSDFSAVLKRIGINDRYEEFFITDYETNIPKLNIGEYDNIDELNELAEDIKNLDDSEILIMSAYLDRGATVKEAVAKCDDGSIYYDCYSDQDLGYEMIERMGGIDNLEREVLETYFDYEGFGRDERINDNLEEVEPGTWVALYW